MPDSKKTKMVFTGDVFIDENLPSFDKGLKEILKGSDIVSCNFEGPISRDEQKSIKKVGPVLSQNDESIRFLIKSNFNLFNLANNHIMDFGEESLKLTLDSLKKVYKIGAGLEYKDVYKGDIIEKNGLKIGFISLAEWGFGALDDFRNSGYAWINYSCVNELISSMKRKSDFLVVQVHAGVENIEIPLPEWRERYFEIIDLGADLIIGHHPHVVQGYEKYKGKYIFYSLGNFFMQKTKLDKEKSFILCTTINSQKNLDYEIVPVIREGNSVSLLKDKSFEKYFESLSERIINKDYLKEMNEISVRLWKERYVDFYATATNSFSKNVSFRNKLKSMKRILTGRGMDEKMLLHNIGIESHRYLTERFLKLNLKKNGKVSN